MSSGFQGPRERHVCVGDGRWALAALDPARMLLKGLFAGLAMVPPSPGLLNFKFLGSRMTVAKERPRTPFVCS